MTREDKLIQQIRNGRQEYLDELIELYYPDILRYCLWHMPDRESAQDATQETFLKLVRFIGHYEHRGQFRAFLYRIAANTCVDMKRNIFATEHLSEEMATAVCYSEKGFPAAEDREQLTSAYACLDDVQRELILLKYGQELTLREVAAITSLPLRTVQTKLRRALKRMREAITDNN